MPRNGLLPSVASEDPRTRPSRKDEVARRFHEEWLGYVQPVQGLVVSVPVLVEAECHDRHPPSLQHKLRLLCPQGRIGDLDGFLRELLEYGAGDFHRESDLPRELELLVEEGPQLLRPTLGLRRRQREDLASPDGLIPDASTPASRAGAAYLALLWQLPDGLPFDAAEAVTGSWCYAPAAKLDRLLRHCRVPIGLLSNGEAIRLIYAPSGGASGSITFPVAFMAQAGADARHLLDAFKNLLCAQRFFAVAPDRQLPRLLEASRARQADVTNQLSAQVLDALAIFLEGIEHAAEREGEAWLHDLLAADQTGANTLYEGLLTVLLRLVFVLYAEDKELLPVASKTYAHDYSVHALFEQLQDDQATFPDTMNRRFGAWARLLALFRAIHGGARHGDFVIPARHGEVFDPGRFPFLESAGGHVPSIDDGTIGRVLEELVILEGQRLSYKSLDVEQLGSVYEGLIGFKVERLAGSAVCLRGNRVWVSVAEVLGQKPDRRAAFLEDDLGVDRAVVKKLAAGLKAARNQDELLAALETQRARRSARAQAGRLVLQPGPERRRTSAHYTPRALAEKVVRRTLEPLLGVMGKAPASDRLLNLKICDPAMGSGAFLVSACRFLGEQVVAAWTRENRTTEIGKAEDALLRAKRLVAQRCLYGVDKNPLAVNLAKLSLWLETMARDEPFTFVDHALRHGDSLVGLTVEQLQAFHWAPEQGQLELPFVEEAVTTAIEEARTRREEILELAKTPGPAATEEKEIRLRDAEDAIDRARVLGDLIVGAWFSSDNEKGRRAERVRRFDRAIEWLREGGPVPEDLRALANQQRTRVAPFHWMLEFPEIFCVEREDPLDENHKNQVAWMDAFVGNPPFSGKNGIAEIDPAYLPWLQQIHAGAHGNADLCAHFFRRTHVLLGEHGTIGLIATNTIAQGDTRATGLKPIVDEGTVIYDAVRSMPWPGDSAVAVSLLHLAKGRLRQVPGLGKRLDGSEVEHINSRLLAGVERPDPCPLRANEGLCFVGSYVLGMGFTLTPEERKDLIRKNPANAKLIFPYLGGEEVNTSPTQAFDRYVINFGDMSLEEAEHWPDLLQIVREKVKPERDKLANNPDGRRRKQNWWQFGRVTPALNAALAKAKRCLVLSIVTKHMCFAFQPTSRVFSHKLEVFLVDDEARFVVLQSRAHESWARLLSSTMRMDLNYSASDCFDTFPFPDDKHFAPSSPLSRIGKQLYETRAELMVERDQGLTVTYNQLKDPGCLDHEIVALRKLHETMDRAVLDAYGWKDIEVPAYASPSTAAEKAALERFEAAVIDRLFALNAIRADEEAKEEAERAEEQAPVGRLLMPGPRRPPKPASRPHREAEGHRHRKRKAS